MINDKKEFIKIMMVTILMLSAGYFGGYIDGKERAEYEQSFIEKECQIDWIEDNTIDMYERAEQTRIIYQGGLVESETIFENESRK